MDQGVGGDAGSVRSSGRLVGAYNYTLLWGIWFKTDV